MKKIRTRYFKWVAVALLLMAALPSRAQFVNPIATPVWYEKFKVDEIFWLNTTDTTDAQASKYPGALAYRQQSGDSTLYYSNGIRWIKVGKGAVTIGDIPGLLDSLNNRFTKDETEKLIGDSLKQVVRYQDTTGNIVTVYQLLGSLDTLSFLRVETDPTVPDHVKSITTTNISNWNTAFNKRITAASFNTSSGALTLTAGDGTTISVDLDGRYIENTEKGAANGVATLDANGKLTSSQTPSIAITDVYVVSSQAAMLALSATQGDVAIRTDESKSYILSNNSPGTLANWKELLSPTTTTLVSDVNSQPGPHVQLDLTFSNGVLSLTGGGDVDLQTWGDGRYLRPTDTASLSNRINGKQNQLNGTGFVKASGTTISYDNSTYTPASRTITAGNGMTGGGSLAADRTFALGTPGSITLSSTNSVTSTSHRHAFAPGGTTGQYITGAGTLQPFPAVESPDSAVAIGYASGPGLASETGDANSIKGTNISYLSVSSANLPSVAGSAGGVTFNGYFNTGQNGGTLYLQAGVEDGLWWRRRLSNNNGMWYHGASQQWVNSFGLGTILSSQNWNNNLFSGFTSGNTNTPSALTYFGITALSAAGTGVQLAGRGTSSGGLYWRGVEGGTPTSWRAIMDKASAGYGLSWNTATKKMDFGVTKDTIGFTYHTIPLENNSVFSFGDVLNDTESPFMVIQKGDAGSVVSISTRTVNSYKTRAGVEMSDSSISIGLQNSNIGGKTAVFSISDLGASFEDARNQRGIQYAGNYESNFVPTSLVTKQYVDTYTRWVGTSEAIMGNGSDSVVLAHNATPEMTFQVFLNGLRVSPNKYTRAADRAVKFDFVVEATDEIIVDYYYPYAP